MSRLSAVLLLVLFVLLLSACQSAILPDSSAQAVTATAPEATPTIKVTRAILTAKPNFTPTFSATTLAYYAPVEKIAGSGPLTLNYEGNAQVELIDASGQRVLLDVFDPERLSAPAIAGDILLTTHAHPDHIKSDFLKTFPGQQLRMTAGALAVTGIAIRGLPAAHNDGETISEIASSDFLFIIDIGGLRVAHMGDLGQSELTAEQLAAIGTVDVAFMQLSNSYSAMNLANQKGFKLLDQIKPRIIIPTHLDNETAAYAAEKWKATYSETAITLGAQTLPSETWIVFMGKSAAFKEDFKLEPVDWLK